jgi:hypothetical protein
LVEATYRSILDRVLSSDGITTADDLPIAAIEQRAPGQPAIDLGNGLPAEAAGLLSKPLRRRSKAHLAYVRAQPCVVCQRQPCDAHHLKFAQTRALGRKVSDEFTVSMCREHHNELHRQGNEIAWWANLRISPLEVARDFWQTSPIHNSSSGKVDEERVVEELNRTAQS